MSEDTYLREAINNLAVGLRHLTDAEGNNVAREVQDFLAPYPGVYPFICLYPGGTPEPIDEEGDPYDTQTYTVVLRYIVGTTDTTDGRLQSRMWDYMPLLVNTINAHRDLVFIAGQETIPELSPNGVFCRTTRRAGVFRDHPNGGHIGMELEIVIPFDVEIEEEDLW